MPSQPQTRENAGYKEGQDDLEFKIFLLAISSKQSHRSLETQTPLQQSIALDRRPSSGFSNSTLKMFQKLAIAITGLSAAVMGLPTQSITEAPAKDLVRRFGDSYTKYNGDGSIGNGWPGMDRWGSYDQLWNENLNALRNSCNWNGWGANNSEDEINNINWAINKVAGDTGLDKRFILVIMMQESKGCVRVPTTNNGVRNPGLMQSHNGSGSCQGQNPCPWQTIEQMIRDGAAGTSSGDGLKQTYTWARDSLGGEMARAYYVAARKYNSGSVDWGNLNNGLGSTGCYASDVANRFTGWSLAGTSCW